jgi:hypothetical protein
MHFGKDIIHGIFNNTGDYYFIDIMPEVQTMNSAYFAEQIVKRLAALCYPEGRKAGQRRVMIHSDNAPMHKTKVVLEILEDYQLIRMEHLPSRPDLTLCDFFSLVESRGN